VNNIDFRMHGATIKNKKAFCFSFILALVNSDVFGFCGSVFIRTEDLNWRSGAHVTWNLFLENFLYIS
jgi:hypothetical protein